jgi:hypothetical protein
MPVFPCQPPVAILRYRLCKFIYESMDPPPSLRWCVFSSSFGKCSLLELGAFAKLSLLCMTVRFFNPGISVLLFSYCCWDMGVITPALGVARILVLEAICALFFLRRRDDLNWESWRNIPGPDIPELVVFIISLLWKLVNPGWCLWSLRVVLRMCPPVVEAVAPP